MPLAGKVFEKYSHLQGQTAGLFHLRSQLPSAHQRGKSHIGGAVHCANLRNGRRAGA